MRLVPSYTKEGLMFPWWKDIVEEALSTFPVFWGTRPTLITAAAAAAYVINIWINMLLLEASLH